MQVGSWGAERCRCNGGTCCWPGGRSVLWVRNYVLSHDLLSPNLECNHQAVGSIHHEQE